ncbi:MAG: YraN family protein [Phycisphaerae bacterium]|nr:YraN family protein [Phycisphaerae bacterium]
MDRLPHSTAKGQQGQKLAEKFLKKKGLRILARNINTGPAEIDLVARHRRELVFIEVRSRWSESEVRPEETVNRSKQQRLIRGAQAFLKSRRWEDRPVRFDVVAIDGFTDPPVIRYIPDAFSL